MSHHMRLRLRLRLRLGSNAAFSKDDLGHWKREGTILIAGRQLLPVLNISTRNLISRWLRKGIIIADMYT